MASGPDVGDVHANSLLTAVSIGYNPQGFFAAKAFPVVNVDKQTDIYPVYNKSDWVRDLGGPGAAPTGTGQAIRRAPGTVARTVGFGVDITNTYRCTNYAFGFEIPDELRANADAVFNLDRDATQILTSLLNLRFDREFATDMITNGGWGSMTVTSKWSDYSAGTPIEDIRTAARTIKRQTLGMAVGGGLRLLIGTLVYDRLLDHPDIIERIKYTGGLSQPAIVTTQLLAQLFGVDEVIVAESVYTDDEEGTAEASVTYTDVVSDDVLLYWAPPGAQQMAPSAGYLFNWRAMSGNGLIFIRKGRDDRKRMDWIEAHSYLDWVVTQTGSGMLNTDSVD